VLGRISSNEEQKRETFVGKKKLHADRNRLGWLSHPPAEMTLGVENFPQKREGFPAHHAGTATRESKRS
jgi:hypothetical protein